MILFFQFCSKLYPVNIVESVFQCVFSTIFEIFSFFFKIMLLECYFSKLRKPSLASDFVKYLSTVHSWTAMRSDPIYVNSLVCKLRDSLLNV